MQTHRNRSDNTRGISIRDEKLEGYLVDDKGKIVGEAKNFDPYSKQGDIMMYEIDSFGFTYGYLKEKYHLMSEEDLVNDKSLIKELANVKYDKWRRKNMSELMHEWDIHGEKFDNFDFFCRKIYDNLTKS